jgi:hypothetical protein
LAGKIVEKGDAWAPDPDLEAALYGDEQVTPRRGVAEKPRTPAGPSHRKKAKKK